MKKLLLGISSGIFYTFLSIVISLVTVPIYLKFLTKEEFGLYFLMNNIIIWMGLLNVGLRGSFKLQLASSIGKGSETTQLITTFLFSQLFIAFMIACIGSMLSFLIPDFLDSSVNRLEGIHVVFIILSLSFACTLVSNAFSAVLSVNNKDFEVYKGRCASIFIQALVSVLFLYSNQHMIGLAIAALVSEIFFMLYAFYLANVKFEFVQLFFSYFDRKILYSSISIGKWFLAGFLAQLLIRHSDLFLIGKLTNVDEVTRFIISSKLYWVAYSFLLVIIKVASPQLIRIKQAQNTYSLNRHEVLFLVLFSITTVFSAIVIAFVNERFIYWWIGSIYYLGDAVNFLLMLIFVFSSINIGIRTLLLAKNKLKAQKISALLEGVLHLLLTIIFGIFYGLNGVVTGIAITCIISCFITLALNSTRFSHVLKD